MAIVCGLVADALVSALRVVYKRDELTLRQPSRALSLDAITKSLAALGSLAVTVEVSR